MSRSRQWTRFGGFAGFTIVLVLAFAAAVDSAQPGRAQERSPIRFNSTRAVQAHNVVSAAELGDAFTAASEVVRASVVYIRAVSNGTVRGRSPQSGSGSGFIISPDGYIITNNHVVEDAQQITVRLLDRREFPATVIGRDANTDIAVLKIEGENLPAARLGNSDDAEIGEWVLAIGNPLGFTFTVTAGIVSGKGRLLQGLINSNYAIQDFIQTDAAINPGNSGGPLVNIDGEVIGVNSALASSTGFYAGYGFAIPINLARRVTEMLVNDGRVTRSLLGIQIQDATPEDAEFVGLDSIYGVTLQAFSGEGSPAERAGLELGDVIVELDGRHVSYTAQLQQIVGFKQPGEVVDVTVHRRGGVRRTYRVGLIEQDLSPDMVAAVDKRPENELVDPTGTGLGAVFRDLPRNLLARLGDDAAGPEVMQVDPVGPSAGRLRRDDIVTHVGNRRVRSIEDLQSALSQAAPGTIVELRLARNVSEDPRGRIQFQTGIARIRLADSDN